MRGGICYHTFRLQLPWCSLMSVYQHALNGSSLACNLCRQLFYVTSAHHENIIEKVLMKGHRSAAITASVTVDDAEARRRS